MKTTATPLITALVGDGTHWHMPDRSVLALEPGDLVIMDKRIRTGDFTFKTIKVERQVKEVKRSPRGGKHTTFVDGFGFDHGDGWMQNATAEVFRPRIKMRNGWRTDSDAQVGDTAPPSFDPHPDETVSKPRSVRQDSRKPRVSDGVKRAVTIRKAGATKP